MRAGEDLLVNFGDCLEPGTYSLHSTFHKVVNYVRKERLLSLVTPEVGGGPANLVLKDITSARVADIQIKAGYVVIGNLRFFLSREKMYCSTLSSDAVRLQQVVPNLNLFARIVVENSPALSFAFLLEPRRASRFTAPFERKLVERVFEGWEYLERMQVAEGISQIRGVGFGLTPGGDDFIAGLAAGLHLGKNLFQVDIDRELKDISRHSRSGNPISQNLIRYAVQGRFGEKIKHLFQALISGTGADVARYALDVLSIGHTSGADFSAGVIGVFKTHGILS